MDAIPWTQGAIRHTLSYGISHQAKHVPPETHEATSNRRSEFSDKTDKAAVLVLFGFMLVVPSGANLQSSPRRFSCRSSFTTP